MSYSLRLLYSGSDGNAALLRAGECAVLIDAGRCAKHLCTSLREAGVEPDALQAVFLTHEHRDHTAALDVFIKHHKIPVHVAGRSAEKLSRYAGEALRDAIRTPSPWATSPSSPATAGAAPST